MKLERRQNSDASGVLKRLAATFSGTRLFRYVVSSFDRSRFQDDRSTQVECIDGPDGLY
jgi:hypothetical protein